MAFNPSTAPIQLDSRAQDQNHINDPKILELTGYYPYDLTYNPILTPRFGEITPSMSLETVPRDRHIIGNQNSKTVLNRINGNLMNTVREHTDTVFVPLRAIYPINYEKLIPLPTKGDDLPNAALTQIPFFHFVQWWFSNSLGWYGQNDPEFSDIMFTNNDAMSSIVPAFTDATNEYYRSYIIWRITSLAFILSRGQLLDYLDCCFDLPESIGKTKSHLQELIDDYFNQLYLYIKPDDQSTEGLYYKLNPTSNSYDQLSVEATTIYGKHSFRKFIYDSIENGYYFTFEETPTISSDSGFVLATARLVDNLTEYFAGVDIPTIEDVNTSPSPFTNGYFINPTRIAAYQMSVAEFFTNDHIDNVFNAELYYQNLRSVMFPSVNGFTREPTFDYNGVSTEYDLLTPAGFISAFFNEQISGVWALTTSYLTLSMLFVLRRSLRFGDYFSTARPQMFAVGQLSVPVSADGVSVVDMSQNILLQRFFHASNIVGTDFPNFFASFFGVIPSDLGTRPRFISHRIVELQHIIVNNTADNQGEQVTNLLGLADNNGVDVFIDDFGVLQSYISYDILPVYTSGIDSAFHLADRFDYFNPKLQNLGDQAIYQSEIYGDITLRRFVFGYTVRNAEYKYKVSRGHGAAVNSLPGFVFRYPPLDMFTVRSYGDFRISPNFIRDKPSYFDQLISVDTGISPGEYFHFVVSAVQDIKSARPIVVQPNFLF